MRRMRFGIAIELFLLFLLLSAAPPAFAVGNESVNTLPSATTSTFNTDMQNFLGEEDADRYAEMFRAFVVTGGTHATAGTCTSAAFATTAYSSAGHRIVQAAAAINYSTAGCNCANPGSDTAWVIASAISADTTGNFARVTGTDYFVNCTDATQPALPADSAYLMSITITNGAIATVQSLRNLQALPLEEIIAVVNVQDFGALADGSTDNILAFNAARDAACVGTTPGSRAIYIPPASNYYALSTAWIINSCPGITIYGGGVNSMLVATGTDDVIRLTSSNNYTIRDLTLAGESGSGDGIQIGGAASPSANPSHYGTIENIFCRTVDGHCINLQAGIVTHIIRPKFTVNQALPFTLAGSGTTDIGINIADNSNGHNNSVVIEAPLIEGMGTHGIYIQSVDSVLITGGTVEGNGNRLGVLGNAGHANVRADAGSSNVIIQGTFMEQNNDVERNVIFVSCVACAVLDATGGSNAVSPRGDNEITTSTQVRFVNYFTNHIVIDSGSIETLIDGVTVGTQSGGRIVDSGLRTTIRHIINSTNSNFKGGGRRLDSFVNLAENGDLEEWASASAPRVWGVVNGAATRTGTGEADTSVRIGTYALSLQPTAGQSNVYITQGIPSNSVSTLYFPYALLIGRPITVTFWARRSAGSQPGSIQFVYDGGATVDTVTLSGISATFQRFSHTAHVRSGTTSMDVRIASNVGVVDNAMVLHVDGVTIALGDAGPEVPDMPQSNQLRGSYHVVTSTATPVFRHNIARMQSMTMTANVTSVTLSNGLPGQQLCLLWRQDGTGGRTIAGWAADINLTGAALTPTAGANKVTQICFNWDGTDWWEVSRALDQN